MTNKEWLQLLQDLEDLEATLKYTNISSYERVVKKARELLIDFQKQMREADMRGDENGL